MIFTLLLSLQAQGRLAHYHHYLRDYITEKNFQYQTRPYLQPKVSYFQSEKEMSTVGDRLLLKLNELGKKTSPTQLRDCMESVVQAKERGLGKKWRLEITDRFEKFFDKYPDKAKTLSRQDVCALIMIDTDFLIEMNSRECLDPLISGFKLLNKKDFESLDVAVAFLRISNYMWPPETQWSIEHQDWSLDTVDHVNPNGLICIGIRAYRQTAQAIRRRNPKLIDEVLNMLNKTKNSVRAEDKADVQSQITKLSRQKELLIDLMKKEKKG